jgi:DNA-binding NarL/FixJ family response regulator
VHCHPSTISRLLRSTTATRNLDHAIRQIYNLLAEQPVSTATPGDQTSVETARRYAEAHGWATPDRWTDIDHDAWPQNAGAETEIDQIAVSQVLDGQTTRLNYRERRLATQLLTARGLSTRDIADRLAVDPRTVSRYRGALAASKDLPKRQAPALAQRSAAAGPRRSASRPIEGGARGPGLR